MTRNAHAQAVRAGAQEFTGARDLDVLVDRIGDAGCVLLGECTHGTSEFYALRAHITQRLIEEKGFRAVAVEADWPDAYRAGCCAHGGSDDPDATAALGDFTRFPRWMWRNREVEAFLRWLREHDEAGGGVGFYGLDLYSLHASIDKVVRYLALLRRAERAPRAQRRALPPRDVPRRSRVVEPARQAHGRDARRAAHASRARRRAGPSPLQPTGAGRRRSCASGPRARTPPRHSCTRRA